MSSVNNADYKYELVDATLKLCQVHMASPLLIAHEKLFSSGKLAHYPYLKSELKTFAIPAGHYSFSLDNVFLNKCPMRLIICFLDAEAISGSYAKNPFNFQHKNLNYLALELDGEPIPAKNMTVTMNTSALDSNFLDAMMPMFRSQGDMYSPAGVATGITRSDFVGGYALFVFDLEAEIQQSPNSAETYFPKEKSGNLRVESRFEKALDTTTNMLLYATFPGQFSVDQQRNIFIQ